MTNITDWELKTWEDAVKRAEFRTWDERKTYLPVDMGPGVSPRYSVVTAPQVGMEVSEAFNGDYYPAGMITKVSKSYKRVETDTGHVFYRKKNSARWALKGGTFSMILGHHDERNPHF